MNIENIKTIFSDIHDKDILDIKLEMSVKHDGTSNNDLIFRVQFNGKKEAEEVYKRIYKLYKDETTEKNKNGRNKRK